MARIDIEIEDYLDEVTTKYLVRELLTRKDFNEVLKSENSKYEKRTELFDDPKKFPLPDYKYTDDMVVYIKRILRLKQWHTKNRIIEEIINL
jgi:hypothetical protein